MIIAQFQGSFRFSTQFKLDFDPVTISMASLAQLNYIKTIHDRMDVIAPLVKSGKVLDLGVVASRRSRRDTSDQIKRQYPNLLFRKISEINPACLGVDIDEKGVEILREQGFNTKAADVITMDLQEQFDAIVAGEIIEHLPNAGLFLSNMARHLTEDGTLIISTPNPFYAKQTWEIWCHNRPRVHEEHTCWFDPITLSNLCHLSGLNPYAIYWVQRKTAWYKIDWFKVLPGKFRSYFSHSFVILAKRAIK